MEDYTELGRIGCVHGAPRAVRGTGRSRLGPSLVLQRLLWVLLLARRSGSRWAGRGECPLPRRCRPHVAGLSRRACDTYPSASRLRVFVLHRRGNYGAAFLCRENASGSKFVVKKVETAHMTDEEKEQASREVRVV